jgi:hypothetical protein
MSKDSNQRAGTGSGVVVMPARCMPFTVASGPGSARMSFQPWRHRPAAAASAGPAAGETGTRTGDQGLPGTLNDDSAQRWD